MVENMFLNALRGKTAVLTENRIYHFPFYAIYFLFINTNQNTIY